MFELAYANCVIIIHDGMLFVNRYLEKFADFYGMGIVSFAP